LKTVFEITPRSEEMTHFVEHSPIGWIHGELCT
jgi:hypothetical protein